MNYVWYHLKHDPKFWVKVVIIPAVLVVALLDFLSHMFKPPGIFNLWFFKITVGVAVLLVIIYGIYLHINPRREKKLVADQALFERQRASDFRKIIAQNPGFQTFCYTCVHFNTEIKACRLDIRNPKARDMPLNDQFKYCLYWESLNRSS
jgi:hypothetical protein